MIYKPNKKPTNPNFSSGPTAKRPGWSILNLQSSLVSRSHRSIECKKKLKEVTKQGITRRLMGVKIESKEINVTKSIKIFDERNNEIGEIRSGVYSPHFGKIIGIAMIFKPYWNNSQSFKIELNNKSFDGKVCDLPFI